MSHASAYRNATGYEPKASDSGPPPQVEVRCEKITDQALLVLPSFKYDVTSREAFEDKFKQVIQQLGLHYLLWNTLVSETVPKVNRGDGGRGGVGHPGPVPSNVFSPKDLRYATAVKVRGDDLIPDLRGLANAQHMDANLVAEREVNLSQDRGDPLPHISGVGILPSGGREPHTDIRTRDVGILPNGGREPRPDRTNIVGILPHGGREPRSVDPNALHTTTPFGGGEVGREQVNVVQRSSLLDLLIQGDDQESIDDEARSVASFGSGATLETVSSGLSSGSTGSGGSNGSNESAGRAWDIPSPEPELPAAPREGGASRVAGLSQSEPSVQETLALMWQKMQEERREMQEARREMQEERRETALMQRETVMQLQQGQREAIVQVYKRLDDLTEENRILRDKKNTPVRDLISPITMERWVINERIQADFPIMPRWRCYITGRLENEWERAIRSRFWVHLTKHASHGTLQRPVSRRCEGGIRVSDLDRQASCHSSNDAATSQTCEGCLKAGQVWQTSLGLGPRCLPGHGGSSHPQRPSVREGSETDFLCCF